MLTASICGGGLRCVCAVVRLLDPTGVTCRLPFTDGAYLQVHEYTEPFLNCCTYIEPIMLVFLRERGINQ